MIVTVTLNPSLDRTLSVPKLCPGAVHRAQFIRQDLGGKGINVSRALRALDIRSLIMGFVGGSTGRALQIGLVVEGFDVHFVALNGDTRQNITILDEASGECTKINEPGPTVDSQNIAALHDQIEQTLQPGDLWAFCGSLPPGAPPDLYSWLIHHVQERGALGFFDSSGSAFRAGLVACPFAIKVNTEEAAEFLGRTLDSDHDVCNAAHELQMRGARLVVLTHGARGLVLAMNDKLVIATPPSVAARSPIGAGDAAMAGLLWAIVDRCDLIETARRVLASGTAATMQAGTGVGDRALIKQILEKTQVTVL